MAKKDTPAQSPAAPRKNGQTTSRLPLFYSNPVPLDKQKHASLSLKRNMGLGFVAGVNAVPVNAIEMPQISLFYPIAFSPDENATPVAILGLRDGENLFVDAKNHWAPDMYIPSYIRRYPFIFSEVPGGDQLTLCVDMTESTVSENGDQPFFEKDGSAAPLAKSAMEFCKSYHGAALQTSAFSKAIAESGLLVDREARINVGDKARINFSGFRVIDEKKFAELPDATFLEWRKRGWLAYVYAHLFSGAQWQRLTHLLTERMKKDAA
ncbi:MAG TPA: SapC family protein [Alphaproteobacteria bacterium]|nr:SapC family protein [Alphaproteobacteria bacterium]